MTPLLSHLVCLLVIWPALALRFNAPSPRPAPRAIARQWATAGQLGGRLFAVRLQLVIA